MDIIDFELKRYESMQLELESKKVSAAASLPYSKSTNNLDTIMNVEKPPEVNFDIIVCRAVICIYLNHNYFLQDNKLPIYILFYFFF